MDRDTSYVSSRPGGPPPALVAGHDYNALQRALYAGRRGEKPDCGQNAPTRASVSRINTTFAADKERKTPSSCSEPLFAPHEEQETLPLIHLRFLEPYARANLIGVTQKSNFSPPPVLSIRNQRVSLSPVRMRASVARR